MIHRVALAKIFAVIILFLVVAAMFHVNAPTHASQLVPSLVVESHGFDSATLDKFKAHGVNWVVLYGSFDSPTASHIHSLGMKALAYVTALKEPENSKNGIWNGYETVIPNQSWSQYDGMQYLYPDPGRGSELWFSPYGPYIDQVVIPRIRKALELGADGIFLDTLILYPGADRGEYARVAWETKYGGAYGIEFGSQEFRYLSLVDAAQRIHSALKSINPEAVLIISDNNVCVQSPEGERATREKFASAIDRWQNYADGFVIEYVGMVENNYPQDPFAEVDAIVNVWMRERTDYGVQKPMWVIAYTSRDDIYEYMKGKSGQLGFGYWTWHQYLISKQVTTTSQTSTQTTETRTTTSFSTTFTHGGSPFGLHIRTTSQISNLNFDPVRRLINFTAVGPDGTSGFCNVTISKSVLDGYPMVLLNNAITTSSITEDETNYYIYFVYQHSSKSVTIGGQNSIPEFPNERIMFLIAIVFLLATVIHRRKKRLAPRRE